MITDIRKQFKFSAYRTTLWAIIFALCAGYLAPVIFRSGNSGATGAGWALRVNQTEISHQDFAHEVEERRQRIAAFRAQYGEYADMLLASMGESGDPRYMAVEGLIRKELIHQAAGELGVQVHHDYIVKKLSDLQFVWQELGTLIPPYAVDQNGIINTKLLNEFLRRRGISTATFERQVEHAIERSLVMQLVSAANHTPAFALKQQYMTDHAAKKFEILTLSYDALLAEQKKQAITDEQLKKFFDIQNKQYHHYWVNEKRGGLQWTFNASDFGVRITDREIASYYEDHKIKEFLDQPAKVQVRRILLKVDADDVGQKDLIRAQAQQINVDVSQDPSTFAAVAQKISQDAETAKDGGLVPFFSRGQKEKAFERTAFLLEKDGDISDVVETEAGFEIVQRVKKHAPMYEPLSKVENRIKDILTVHAFKKQFTSQMRALVDGGNTQEEILAFTGQKSGKREILNLQEQGEDGLSDTLFRLEKGQFGFYMNGEHGVLVQMNEVQGRYLPTLDTIKKTVSDDYYEERTAKAVGEQLTQMKKEAATGFDSLKMYPGVSVSSTSMIKPEDQKELQELQNKGFQTSHIMRMDKIGMVVSQTSKRNGYLIRVSEVGKPEQKALDAKQAEIVKAARAEQGQLLMDGFVASLYRNATIETSESLTFSQEEYSA